MAIGERIHFFRNMRGMTQRYLGMLLGFPEKSADVRLAQYETGTRTPKADLTAALAYAFDVAPEALSVPDIDSFIGLMHTLFSLEDRYGFVIEERDGRPVLQIDASKVREAAEICQMMSAWAGQARKLKNGEITREEYDKWRYCFPKYDTTQIWAKVPSQELSDALVEEFKDKLKDM